MSCRYAFLTTGCKKMSSEVSVTSVKMKNKLLPLAKLPFLIFFEISDHEQLSRIRLKHHYRFMQQG